MSLATSGPVAISVPEAAKCLSVTEHTIRRMCADGELRYVRMGKHIRIPTDAIADFLTAPPTKPVTSHGTKRGADDE